MLSPMRRSAKRSTPRLAAWLIGMLVPVALLVLLFSVADHRLLTGQWPLGVRSAEVEAYASWLDLRPEHRGEVRAEPYHFGGSKEDGPCLTQHKGPGWTVRWFEAEGYGDSVEVRRLRTTTDGFVVKFKRDAPFRAQRHIVLIPATDQSLRAKYLEVIAGDLGLVTPEVSFVRVIACGRDLGLFLKEERMDADFLEKRRMTGAPLFEQGSDHRRPDHLFPAFDDDTVATTLVAAGLEEVYHRARSGDVTALLPIVDREAAAARIIMHALEGDGGAEEELYAYHWSRGRIVPLYRHARHIPGWADTTSPALYGPLRVLLQDEGFQAQVRARWELLKEERWRLRERLTAMDRAWLPLLAAPGELGMATARAERMRDELLGARLDGLDPVACWQRELVPGPGRASFAEGMPKELGRQLVEEADSVMAAIIRRYKVQLRGDTIVFPRGRYLVDRDLVFPAGRPVLMLDGARLELAAGVSLLVQGPLEVRGTRRNPVFVRSAQEGAPFGSFAVLGDDRITCLIRGLQLSGGSESRVRGVYFTGQFAIHGAARTELVDCIIGANAAEDGLNIKGGTVLLRDCVFEDGQADLVDLDYCTGRVERCSFRSGRVDSNGDGLDVSGARILVEDCRFLRMMDKAISVGEASQLLVRRSVFEGNNQAVVAKDLSIAHVIDNIFTDNLTVFAAYRKKPIYGGARVLRYANSYVNNGREQDVDGLSTVLPADSLPAKVLGTFLSTRSVEDR